MNSKILDETLVDSIHTNQLRQVLSELVAKIDDFDIETHKSIHSAAKAFKELDDDVTHEIKRLRDVLDGHEIDILKLDQARPDAPIHVIEFVVRTKHVGKAAQLLEELGYVCPLRSNIRVWNLFARFYGRATFTGSTSRSLFRLQIKWKPEYPIKGRIGKALRPSVADFEAFAIPRFLWPAYPIIHLLRKLVARESSQPEIPLGPYLGTPESLIGPLLKFSGLNPGGTLVDLGCGDGRIILAAAKQLGCNCLGYELDGQLAARANAAVQESGLESQVQIFQADASKAEIENAQVVFVFLPVSIITELFPKLIRNLKPGTVLIAHELERIQLEKSPDEQIPLITRGGVTVASKWIIPADD